MEPLHSGKENAAEIKQKSQRMVVLKINKKYENIVFTFIMAFGMSCLISFFMMLINLGFSQFVFLNWLKSWEIAFVFAFPAAYFFPRVIRKVMRKITFVESK